MVCSPILAGIVLAASSLTPATGDLPGETIANALPVPALPFTATGNTCAYVSDYDEICPFGGNGPDVVYSYEATDDVVVNVSLCESSFDTKTFIYTDTNGPGNPYACNDDACSGPNYPLPYASYLREVSLLAGTTYYFVVSAYGTECGDYVLRIVPAAACDLPCPAGADEEGEPKCRDDYVVETNGGCDGDPPVFQAVEPGPGVVAICGFSGTFDQSPWVDFDWYEITLAEAEEITIDCTVDFAAFLSLYDAAGGCSGLVPLAQATLEACESWSVSETLAPGVYWLRVRSLLHRDVSCSSRYVLRLTGYDGPVASPIRAGGPSSFGITEIRPNPFVESGAIRFVLAREGRASLRIVDVSGRLVRVLVDGPRSSGPHSAVWDGRDVVGAPVGPGVYFVRLESGGSFAARKLVRGPG